MNIQTSIRNATLLGGILAAGATRVFAQEPSIQELDQKIRILERKLEINEEEAAKKKAENPTFTAGKEGFAWTSADKNYQLKLRGFGQADARFFVDDSAKTGNDTFVVRRARITFDGRVGQQFEFRIAPDFGGGSAQLQDGYLDFKPSTSVNARFGRSKVPFGLERLQTPTDTLLNETALSTGLTPNYDQGILLYGALAGGVLEYSVGVVNGSPDGASIDSDANDAKDVVGRLWLTPFKKDVTSALSSLSVGVAATSGKQEGSATAAGLPAYRSAGQQSFFSYRTSTNASDVAFADGDRTRLSPQFYYAVSRFGILGEYVISEQDVSNAKTSQSLENEGWQVGAQIVLTGETPSLKGLKPVSPFDRTAGTWGAFELIAQISSLDVDDAAFSSKLADPAKSASKADSVGGGLNWYLTSNAKFALNYITTTYTGGAAKGADRADENVVIARAQLTF